MSLFTLLCGIVIVIAIGYLFANMPLISEDWAWTGALALCGVAIAAFISLIVSAIALDNSNWIAYYETSRYDIKECVETIENYDITYYDPNMGYKDVSLYKKDCYLNPLPEGKEPYVIVKITDFDTERKRDLFWLVEKKYVYCLYLPEGGN